MQIIRKSRPLKGRKWTTETVYAVTDLDSDQNTPNPTNSQRGYADIGR
jgi:hypothetical protein